MIFPDLSTGYLDEKDRGMIKRMENFYSASITVNQAFWTEADIDTRFMAGDQTLWSDLYGNQVGMMRQQFNFNRIARIVNKLDGHQRNNRKSTIVQGILNADDETADQFTRVLMWVNQHEKVLETISDSFRGGLITGMNLLQVWMDYRSDPVNGDIKVDNCSFNSFLIDPFFRKQDLSDCQGIWKRSFLSKRECIALMPNYEKEIAELSGIMGNDGRFMFMPEQYAFSPKNSLIYDEFYYPDYRKQKLLLDTETGETQEWRSPDKEGLDRFLTQYPQITMIESDVPTVKLAIVIQGKVFYDGPQPSGLGRYPFAVTLAYHYPELQYFPYRHQGVVRGLRDSQYLYNRRQIIQLRILESQITSGIQVKEGTLVNDKDAFTLMGEGKGLFIKREASMDDVRHIVPPTIPAGMMEITKMLGEEISQISGVSEEAMGFDNKETLSGYHAQLKQSASMVTTQILYDNLDVTQKHLGDVMVDLIQLNWTPGKIQKILEGEQPTDQFYNKAFGKYGSIVTEGLNTATQKNMQFAQLLMLREAGIPVPDSVLLESSTMQNKKQLIEAIEQEKQAMQQQQQQMADLQSQLQMSQIELNKARAVSDQGLGLERISRVEENEALAVERRAQAVRDEDEGLLAKVKALKELESLDISHLKELILLATALRTNPDETAGGKKEEETKENELAGKLQAQPEIQPQPVQM